MADSELVDAARALAVRAHADQRYGTSPYTTHLAEAVAILGEVGVTDPELLAAGWLHDVVEDTTITLDEVRLAFGDRVAALVGAVTDDPGNSRHERKAGAYRRIRRTPGAAVVKLADRLANVRAGLRDRDSDEPSRAARGTRKLTMYAQEQTGLVEAIRSPSPRGAEARLWSLLGVALDPSANSTSPS